jgi:hypothetical protein
MRRYFLIVLIIGHSLKDLAFFSAYFWTNDALLVVPVNAMSYSLREINSVSIKAFF